MGPKQRLQRLLANGLVTDPKAKLRFFISLVVDQRMSMFYGSVLNMKSTTAAEAAAIAGEIEERMAPLLIC